jgi:hypothetical protein
MSASIIRSSDGQEVENQEIRGWICSMEGEFVDVIHLRCLPSCIERRGTKVDPGSPYQFCSPMKGLADNDPVYVTSYPVGWRIQRADNNIHHGFEYVK